MPAVSTRAWLHDPLPWALGALLALAFGMAHLKPLFAVIFPQLERPLYEQDSFIALLLAHVQLVALSSVASLLVGLAAGIFVTRAAGREFRGLVDALVAAGQAVPPVAGRDFRGSAGLESACNTPRREGIARPKVARRGQAKSALARNHLIFPGVP